MIRPLLAGLCALAVVHLPAAEEADPGPAPVALWDLHALTDVRERVRAQSADLAPAVEALRKQAVAVRKDPLMSVVDKVAAGATPVEGGPRQYVSISIYFWPDPQDPQAPWLKRDGDQNREAMAKYDAIRFRRATDRIIAGSLAWWFLGDEDGGADAAKQLRHWFLSEETGMLPNLDYAQFIPNTRGGKGNAHGLIDSRYLVEMLSAVALLERGPHLTADDRRGLRTWVRAYLDWLLTSDLGQKEDKAANNHAVYYDLQVAAFALYVGDRALAERVLSAVGPRRLQPQIAPEGSFAHELARPIAATYTCFTLEGLAQLVALERRAGLASDLWAWTSEDGRALPTAVKWLLPFLDGTRPWTFGRADDPLKPERVGRILRMLTVTKDPEVLAAQQRYPVAASDRLRLLEPQ